MPDPSKLKVGDKIRFVGIPDEWENHEWNVADESREFMKILVKRNCPSRIYEIDEFGHPWIKARIREKNSYQWHTWSITEHSGWILVKENTNNTK